MKINGSEMEYGVLSQKNRVEQKTSLAFEEKNSNIQEDDFFSENEVENSVEELNEAIEVLQRDLKFQLHEASDRMMVKIINIKDNEVIKELPPEEVLDMIG